MLARFRLLLGALFLTLTLAMGAGCSDAAGEDVGSSEGAATDTSAAREAREALEEAIEKKEETDVRLGRALGRVGAMVTTEQHRAFVQAFNKLPDVALIDTDYHTRSIALAAELDKIAADPMAIDQYGPRRLFDGYALLAKTPGTRSSLAFAAKVMSGRIVLPGIRTGDVGEKILGPALAPSFLANLFEKGTRRGAIDATDVVLEQGGGICLQVADWLERYNALNGHDIVAEHIGISSTSTIQSLRTIAGLIAIWEIGSELAFGDVPGALQQFLDSGPNAVSGLAEAASLLRRVILGIQASPLADQIIKWSGKIATGIGIVMAAIQLWHDAGKWHDSMDAKVRVFGDIVALGASILVLAGAGPVGPILGAVALGIHFLADWLENRRLAETERADLAACLPAAGIDAKLTQTMIDSSPILVRVLAKDAHLGPADIQWMLKTSPMVVSEKSYTPIRFIGIQVAQKVFELDAAETMGMLRAAVGTETDAQKAEYKLDMFLRGIEFGTGFRGDLTKAEGIEWLNGEANSPFVRDGEQKTLFTSAFLGASAYLAAN